MRIEGVMIARMIRLAEDGHWGNESVAHMPMELARELRTQLDADAANAGDAAEWRALQEIERHEMYLRASLGILFDNGNWYCWARGSHRPDAPTPTALLAKLDGLAEAAKPREEPDTAHRLLCEIECRIDHGAESSGHLEYVRDRLRKIVGGQP